MIDFEYIESELRKIFDLDDYIFEHGNNFYYAYHSYKTILDGYHYEENYFEREINKRINVNIIPHSKPLPLFSMIYNDNYFKTEDILEELIEFISKKYKWLKRDIIR